MRSRPASHGRRFTSKSVWAALALLFVAAGALGWKVRHDMPRKRPLGPLVDLSDGGRAPGDPYIGSRVCRQCHAEESILHARSGHARTLMAAALHPAARLLDARSVTDPENPAITWTYQLRNDRFQVERNSDQRVETIVLDYALGSSDHATTFLSVASTERPTALEHRLTYFGRDDTLKVTPGQQDAERQQPGTTARGRWLTPKITTQCFECHATQTSALAGRPLDFDTMIPNVSCESCHGPARSHVAAARGGEVDLTMPMGLGQWTAESQMKLCGRCHRHPADYPPSSLDPANKSIARFQPIGIMQSKCYKQSGGELSCVTCHDPHARASSDRQSYESTCLKCHSDAGQTFCPKSPGGGCVDCHMPRVSAGQKVLYTDHWIRVRQRTEEVSR